MSADCGTVPPVTYIPPSRRGVCSECGKTVAVSAKSSATPRCHDCRRKSPWRKPRNSVTEWVCEWCGEENSRPYTKGQKPRYCPEKCQQQASDSRRVALRGEFTVHRARRRRLYDRDGYTCQICWHPTAKVWTLGDPWSPTLDHIVPRSVVVDDSDDNLRTVHHFCNAYRSNDKFTDDEVRLAADARRDCL